MRLADRFFSAMILVMCCLTLGAGPEAETPQANSDAARPSMTSNRNVVQLRRLAAEATFRDAFPDVKLYRHGANITRVFGPAFSSGASAVDSAEAFRRSHAQVFGVEVTDLRPHSLLPARQRTQPLMYEPDTDSYKFTLVYYTQYSHDIPVFRADLRLLVRNEPGNPLVLASSGLRNMPGFAVDPNLRADIRRNEFVSAAFADGRRAATTAFPMLVNFSDPEVVVWAGVDDMVVEPRTAVVFVGDDAPAPNLPANEKWLFVTDIATGQILYQENQILEIDVVGNVSALATEGSGAEQCEAELLTPMPHARVNIGGTIAFADVNGDYVIPNAGGGSVTVDSGVRGQYFRVFHEPTGAETVLSSVVTPPGPLDFLHNGFNTEFRRGEVNAYIAANVIRDFVLNINPAYPVIGGQTEFSITVNEGANSFCPGNAQYQGTNLRFCAAGGSAPNTAWSSVVYHEYGHHLVAVAGSGQGQYGEGMGDAVSILLLDESGIGFGFFGAGTCNTPLRESDNTRQYPCSGEVHDCGELIAACVWHTRNELLLTNSRAYRQILSNLAINSIPLHTGSTITPQITIDWLTLDDDDANILNGTPHYPEICAGFGAHNMDCPALQLVVFDYPGGRPALVTPNQATPVAVNVTGLEANPVSGTGTVFYRINSMGTFISAPMTEGNPNEYVATLPAADCPDSIEYYFSVDVDSGGTVTDPANAPTTVFQTVAAQSTSTVVDLDFEVDPGWTVSGTAGDGAWNRGIPVNCSRGDPPQDFDASGQCWLTDNSAANSCNSDVDNGVTTLTSDVMDLSGLGNPQVSYARWFSNNTGGGPETDTLVVDISSDGGGLWTNLETVGPTSGSPNGEVAGGWFVRTFSVPATSQFRIRFTVEDVGTQSVVESGIDAFSVFHFVCPVPCPAAAGDMNGIDGTNGEDIQLFVDGVLGAPTQPEICAGDFDGDNALGFGDMSGMVNALLSGLSGP